MSRKIDEILTILDSTYDYTFNSSVTAEEITSIINSLPEGKLPCIDGVNYEHIKHVGEIIVELL